MQIVDIQVTIRRLVAVFVAFFVVVSGWLVYWQVFWHGTTQGQAATVNYDARQCVPGNVPQRGTIYDRNKVRLAWSVQEKGAPCGWRRHYADPNLAPLIGYYDPTGFGVTGLELAYNDILSGTDTNNAPTTVNGVGDGVNQAIQNAEHQQTYGNDVYLTIDAAVQDKVISHFNEPPPCGYPYVDQNRPGSIIVEDPHTGEILAMVSYPIFDNDKLVDHTPVNADDPNSLTVGQQTWNALQVPDAPLLFRPTQTAVVPGSTFKMMTLIAGFDSGQFTPSSGYDRADASTYTVDGHTFVTNNLSSNIPDSAFPLDLIHLFAYSDNVAYARTAVALGKQTWLKYAASFGMSYGDQINDIKFDLPTLHSWVFQPQFQHEWDQDNVLFADTGYGQGKLLVTPLMVATMVSTVAADGKLYAPHLKLKEVLHGQSADATPNDPVPAPKTVISPQAAHGVQQALRAVVSYGTGALSPRARSSAVLEGGKTGTGDLGKPLPATQSWWSSIAPVAVDENGASTGQTPRYTIIIQKDLNGEGFCQSEIALHIYEQILLPNMVSPA